VVPPLVYAVMGTSREIAIGPVAVVSLLLSSMMEKLVDPASDPLGYTKLILLATLLAGIFQTSFGLFRSSINTYAHVSFIIFIISIYGKSHLKNV